MKTVLVTGCAGFLGSHLANHHVSNGDMVYGIDDFSSSRDDSNHLRDLCKFDNFFFINKDICENLVKYFDLHVNIQTKFDVIYNFACPASPPRYQEIPVKTMLTCVVGTSNVLDLASLHGSTVVHASTSEVYGDPDCSPQRESYRGSVNSYGPRSCYDEGKRAAEALCFDYLNMHNVDARLVRIFNTYGTHMAHDDGRVVSNFICQALKGNSLSIYGSGNQTRSFCYVDDLVRAIVKMGSLSQNPMSPINIGNPNEFTINDLAEKVMNRIPGQRIDRFPLPIDDPMQRCPDITCAKQILGWEPKISLDEGLDRTIEYFRSVIK